MNPGPDRTAVEHPTGRSEGATARRPTIAPAYALALLACTAFALWLVWPAFEPGRLMNLDAPRHLLRAQVMARQFLPSGHVDGWSPWWYLGAQLFLFQSYGWFFVIGATAALAGAPAHLGAIFKFWYVLPLVVLPAATARMARRLGVSATGAVVAAIASLMFSSPLGYGMEGLFGVGLLLQAVGVAGFALAWPAVLDTLLDRGRAPWSAVLLLAAVLLAHFISGAYALAAGGLAAAYFAWRSRRVRPLLRYALVAGLVLLLAGHTLFPSLLLRELAGTGVGWGSERDRLARLLAGTLFGGRPLALAGLAAAGWTLWRGSPRLAATALVFVGTAVLAGSDEQVWEPSALADVLRVYVRPRALPYAALLQAVFVGVAVDFVVRRAGDAIARTGRARWSWVVVPAALAVVLGVAVPEAATHRGRVVTESQLKPRERRVYTNLVMWLRRNVKRPAIVAVPRTLLPRSILGARSVISLLNLDTGLYSLSGDQAELTKAGRRADRIDLDRLPHGAGRTAELLRKAGVSHVIVSLPSVRQRLSASDDFELVYEDAGRVPRRDSSRESRRPAHGKAGKPEGVAVYRLKGGGQWLHADGLRVLAMHHAPERTTWDVRVAGRPPNREAVAAINWHPNWTATVDGEGVPTRRTAGARVAFDLPAGAARVTLEFVRSAREKAWNAMSAATLALVLALQARHVLRARREREPAR